MFSSYFARLFPRRRVFRAWVGVVLTLWWLPAFASGATRVLCLDLGGDCSSSSPTSTAPCHGEAAADGLTPGCGACVDVLVPGDALARGNRPDRDFQAPVQALVAARGALFALEGAAAAAAPPPFGRAPSPAILRAAVLRI